MKKETREWLEKAEKDLDDGIFNFENGRTEVAIFLFHQAVEKSLKALQIEKTGKHDFSHDLLALSGEHSRDKFKELFIGLNPVYTGFRYPDVGIGRIEDLDKIRYRTEELIKWIKKQLKN